MKLKRKYLEPKINGGGPIKPGVNTKKPLSLGEGLHEQWKQIRSCREEWEAGKKAAKARPVPSLVYDYTGKRRWVR